MKIYINVVLLTLTCCFQACSQPNGEKQAVKIMSDTRFDKVKSYMDNGFGWFIRLGYEHVDCSYEILVNDVPIITFFGLGNWSTGDYANRYIMKSGPQQITIRLYPQKVSDTVFKESLSADSKMKIRVLKRIQGFGKRPDSLANEPAERELYTYETPTVEEGAKFAEFKTSFDLSPADINWDITGWSESEDLRNHPNIKQEVMAFYKMYMQVIEKRDKKAYTKLVEYDYYEHMLSEPWHVQAMYEGAAKDIAKNIAIKQKFMFPLEEDKVKLKFYGDGRVVTLVSTDHKSYGYSPLVAKEISQNFPMAHTFYLHRPKGSKDLEIVR